jgi:hypothetical protein
MRLSRRSASLTVAVLALVAAGADATLCQVLRNQLHAQFKLWAQGMRAQGFLVTYGALRTDGFPWGGRVVVPNLVLSGGRAVLPGGLEWHAERLVLLLPLTQPTRLTVEPEGVQELQLAGGPAVAFFAEQLSATVKLGSLRPDQIDVTAEGLAGGFRHSPAPQDVRIGALKVTLQAEREGAARTTARMSVSARQVGLPDDGRWPLGATISRLTMDLSLASPALSGESAAEQAQAWHDWGGLLTVESLALRWGPLDVDAVAELDLDARLQPAGSGTARVRGATAALEALSRGGALPAGVAATANAVLALMPVEAGETRVLPFTLAASTLSVGKTPLMRLGDVDWGKP